MRVLVTGGAGFIGSHLVERLVREGEKVTVLDNLTTGRRENLSSVSTEDTFRFVEGDIRDREIVRSCVKDADRVVHLAAIASVPFSTKNPGETHDVNVEGTLNILRECGEHKVVKMVYASSCAVYGEPLFLPVTEDHRLSATSPYAASKIAAEAYCQVFREKHGLETVCLRAFNVYGSRQHNSDYGGVMTQFIGRLMKHQPPMIYGDGEQSRDFIHVNDLVDAVARILHTPNGTNGTYNLGSGKATTINELARILQRLLGDGEFRPVYALARTGDIRHSQADMGKARREFGFEPLTGLDDGLQRLVSEANLGLALVPQRTDMRTRVGNAEQY
jgi:nucleoside-diphosphate-sugar epimerase